MAEMVKNVLTLTRGLCRAKRVMAPMSNGAMSLLREARSMRTAWRMKSNARRMPRHEPRNTGMFTVKGPRGVSRRGDRLLRHPMTK